MKTTDSVGNAIHQMQENLMHLSQQHSENIWIQNGRTQVMEILRGDKVMKDFAKELITCLLDFLNSQIGTFYTINNEHQLTLVYCIGASGEVPHTIEKDNSYIGQAISRKKVIILNDVVKDFFKVHTSLGSAMAVSTSIIPLYSNEQLIGVIEIGKLSPFNPLEQRFIESIASPIGIYTNSILGKTALEKLLQDLDAKEQELQNQIKAINKANLVIEFDTHGTIISANDLFLKIMGFEREELIGKHHKFLVDQSINYESQYSSFWQNLNAGNTETGEFQRISKNKKYVWLQASYNPVFDKNGKVYKILKIGYDITELKEQHEATSNITLKLNQQIEVLNKAAIVSETDAEGNIIFVNDFFCHISEYSKEELIGKNHRILKSGKQPDGLFKGMWKAVSSGLTWQGEILNISKTGKLYWVETTIMPFKNKEGKIEKYVAIRFDITKQKESEALKRQTELLLASQKELEEANAEMEAQTQKLQASDEELRVQQEELMQSNKELEEKTKLLEEKNQAFNEKNNLLEIATQDLKKKAEQLTLSSKYKSEFLANMSHELRTPLNSILLLSKLLQDNLDENLNDDQIEYATVINKAGTSLLELINDILDISKIESGKMDVNAETFTLEKFKEDIVSLFSPISKDKEIEFLVSVNSNCPETIYTDKMRLDQVVKNLLSNAFKFSPKGKVNLNISVDQTKELISFSVIDTGIGIPKEKQDLVFEAFQQADGSTRRQYGGTGLGLSISREIAHLLGGEITLESEPGKGSNFTITIPSNYSIETSQKIKKQAHSATKATIDTKTTPLNYSNTNSVIIDDDRLSITKNDKTVLIVEDDEHFVKILQTSAKNRGYKVIIATNGNDAVSLAKQYIPGGIILDMHLPHKNGWEVLKELKEFAATKHIPVHIVSSEDLNTKSIKELGASDFTNKPISETHLQHLFESLEKIASKEHGQIALFSDRLEHGLAMNEFLKEQTIEVISFNPDDDLSASSLSINFDAIVIDIDARRAKVATLLEKLSKLIPNKLMPVIVLSNTYLSSLDLKRINQYNEFFILKIVKSYSSVIDEISLFLHYISKHQTTTMRPAIIASKVLENKTILVVDDDYENRFSIGKILEAQKAHVIFATNWKEALEKWNTHSNISLILMDVMMPEMDGYETMREIRQFENGKQVPIISITARTQADERQKCIDSGASDYVSKPIDADLLVSLIRVWILNSNKN